MSDDDYDHLIKLVLVGDSSVGKSSILMRFTEGEFDENKACTIGVDFKLHLMDFGENLKVHLTIWDTAGQEKFHSLTSSYYRGAHGVLVVYDVSNHESFDNVTKWMNEVELYSTSNDTVLSLIANKIDLVDEREVTRKEGLDLSSAQETLYAECSSKDDIGIDLLFEQIINTILDRPALSQLTLNPKKKDGTSTIQLQDGGIDTSYSSSCYCT